MMITSRFYYSLTITKDDALSSTNENEFGIVLQKNIAQPPLLPVYVYDRYAPINQEQGIFWLINSLTGESTGNDTSITKELLKHIWLNLYDKNVGYVDIEHPVWENPSKPFSGDDYTNMKYELGNSIWSIYIDTKNRYETLIGIYNNELNNLLAQIETNSETRFNDTPQNAAVSSDTYAADNYTTTITGTKVKTDGTSIMNRIDEIQQKLRDVYADWAFEFNKLILEE